MAEKLPGHAVRNHLEGIRLYTDGYAEPGYSGVLVATGNWNTVDRYVPPTNGEAYGHRAPVPGGDLPERLAKIFEKLGFECEWSDEWHACDECCRLVRQQPDSYSWKPSYALLNECEVYCHECIKKDPEAYLESLEDGGTLTLNIDPSAFGYVKHEECESGWFPGQTDDPKKIAKHLQSKGISRFFFEVTEPSQFYTKWCVWIHEDETIEE
jgi:hypothetical protein